jgi:micrococcal nuclease
MLKPSYVYKGNVQKVVDGDTIDVLIDLGFKIYIKERLRIARIDTAELSSKDPETVKMAIAARDFLVAHLVGMDVIILTSKSDKYGRYIAEVIYVDNGIEKNISDILLENKLAVPYK